MTDRMRMQSTKNSTSMAASKPAARSISSELRERESRNHPNRLSVKSDFGTAPVNTLLLKIGGYQCRRKLNATKHPTTTAMLTPRLQKNAPRSPFLFRSTPTRSEAVVFQLNAWECGLGFGPCGPNSLPLGALADSVGHSSRMRQWPCCLPGTGTCSSALASMSSATAHPSAAPVSGHNGCGGRTAAAAEAAKATTTKAAATAATMRRGSRGGFCAARPIAAVPGQRTH
mmetsp:Transcript_118145/g.329436  ORF Transcript_118145/g.329436 Transcript_118145/m.329436 type:complete len:229 (-) Transcript_118145:39-725(-)